MESNACSTTRSTLDDRRAHRRVRCRRGRARGTMGQMPLYRDEAVVLRTHKLGEADRIITLLTRTAAGCGPWPRACGAPSPGSAARLEPFMVVDVQCYEGRNLDTVTQAESLAPYGHDHRPRLHGLHRARPSWSRRPSGSPRSTSRQTQQYLLLAGALRSLAGGEHDPGLVLDAYLLRSLAVAGWAPSFLRLREVRGARARTAAFNVAGGRCGVPRMPPARLGAPAPETLRLLAALLSGDWASPTPATTRHRREGSGLVTAFLQWHLERGLRSLRLVERPECPDSLTEAMPAPDRPETHVRRAVPASVRCHATDDPGRAACRSTWRSSWTATVAGPTPAACRGPRATRPARPRCSTSWPARSRSA